MQFQNFKCSLLAFYRFPKSLKISKSELDLTNVTGKSYHWCHLLTDVNNAMMHQLSIDPTKLLKILFKKFVNGIVFSTTIENLRYSETPCSIISLFDTGALKM